MLYLHWKHCGQTQFGLQAVSLAPGSIPSPVLGCPHHHGYTVNVECVFKCVQEGVNGWEPEALVSQ